MNWSNYIYGILDTGIYSLFGIVMMVIGFLVIVIISPFSIKKEIAEDQNTALGIIIGSVILGISIIIASVISSPSSMGSSVKQKSQQQQTQEVKTQ
jgi:putative membrane protein